jgi:hypothetical protein
VRVGEPDAPLHRQVRNWPRKPQKLRVFDAAEVMVLLGDVALVLLCLAFSGSLSPRCCCIELRWNAMMQRGKEDALNVFSVIGFVAWSVHNEPTDNNRVGIQVERASKLVSNI